MQIRIAWSRAFPWTLYLSVGAMAVCGAFAQAHIGALRPGAEGISVQRVLVRWFNPDGEGNIAAWFSSALFLLVGVLLCLISMHQRQNGRRFWIRWLFLAIVFLAASVDDTAQLHEGLGNLTEHVVGTHDANTKAGLVPLLIIVGVVGLGILRLFLSLPSATKLSWVTAATLFLSGAMVLEYVGGMLDTSFPETPWLYSVEACTEETLENLGVALFAAALYRYMCRELDGVVLIGQIPPAEK